VICTLCRGRRSGCWSGYVKISRLQNIPVMIYIDYLFAIAYTIWAVLMTRWLRMPSLVQEVAGWCSDVLGVAGCGVRNR